MSGRLAWAGDCNAATTNPLWPAGHLPHKRGEYVRHAHAPSKGSACIRLPVKWAVAASPLPPLVGEMAGRPEEVGVHPG
ncbi:hypothetical protein EV184_110140 [Sinorhizobium americanum]|uniref:Lytic murein transglycosylase n=1 Tax=Sinorhizobium americanum TaxID=194963 RepID=A0A4R2BQ56_9HYPH|nr:hypothetical protein EV184_110140 [Sinorhizobium americanum]